MFIKFTKLSSILLITTVVAFFALEAKAEEMETSTMSVAEMFNNAYFKNSGDNYQNSSFIGDLNNLIGIKGFPENQISADGKLLDKLYKETISNQSQVGTSMKTKDLINPYSTSLQEITNYTGN